MCIDEVTAVMQDIAKNLDDQNDFLSENNVQKDFTAEDLCILKTMFLELENAIDSITLKNRSEGDTFPGGYIFELLEKIEVKRFLISNEFDVCVCIYMYIYLHTFTLLWLII